MKPVLAVPTLHRARWVELPGVVVVSAEWLAERGGIADTAFAKHPIISSEDGMPANDAPAYWLQQRNGSPGGQRLTADEAEMAAKRAGATGNHLSPVGLFWTEPDPSGPGGFSWFTLTPVYGESR